MERPWLGCWWNRSLLRVEGLKFNHWICAPGSGDMTLARHLPFAITSSFPSKIELVHNQPFACNLTFVF